MSCKEEEVELLWPPAWRMTGPEQEELKGRREEDRCQFTCITEITIG